MKFTKNTFLRSWYSGYSNFTKVLSAILIDPWIFWNREVETFYGKCFAKPPKKC